MAKLLRSGTSTRRNTYPKICEHKGHSCTFCSKIFKSMRALGNHMRIHCKCCICSRSFSSKARLTMHIREHRNKGFYKCFQNPAAIERKIIRCTESATIVRRRLQPVRVRKILFPMRKKNRLHARKKLFPTRK